jgi:hypothetical protein
VLVSEFALERRVIELVERVKNKHPEWADPDALAAGLGLTVVEADLGPEREGAALGTVIVLTRGAGRSGRDRFTFYHEITHSLLRRTDDLMSFLHDRYRRQDDFERIIERLVNVGAAEFVVPRLVVVEACRKHGMSVRLIAPLSDATGGSATAVCVQLALTAPHRCVAVVAGWKRQPASSQAWLLLADGPRLLVDVAASSRAMRYVVARDTLIPSSHLLHAAATAAQGEVIEGTDRIPFRTGATWLAECEAVRLGAQVFALLHVDSKPTWDARQIELIP